MTKKFSFILLLMFFSLNLYAGNCPVKEDGVQYIDNHWILTTNAKNEGWLVLDANDTIPMTADTFVEVQIFNPAEPSSKSDHYTAYCYYYANQIRALTLVNEQNDIDTNPKNNDWRSFKALTYSVGANVDLVVHSCSTNINSTIKECTWEWSNGKK